MWKFNIYLLLFSASLSVSSRLCAQDAESQQGDSLLRAQEVLGIGLSYDYLKAHTLLLDDRDKFEFAINLDIYDKISVVASVGNASLRPKDEFKNAAYKSEGNYYRVGLDYILYVNPDNLLFLGLRYSQSQYNESIIYETFNPLYEGQSGNINREGLSADWMEVVISSEKKIKKLFKQELMDLFRIGFKFRLKTNLSYEQFDYANTKLIPGYGLTNAKINPEINLYLKIRLGINKSKSQ